MKEEIDKDTSPIDKDVGKDAGPENLKPELSIDIERPFREQQRTDASYFEKPFIELVLDIWRKNEYLKEYVSELESYLQKQMLEDALDKVYVIAWEIHNKLNHTNPRAFVSAMDKVRSMEIAIEELMQDTQRAAEGPNESDKGNGINCG